MTKEEVLDMAKKVYGEECNWHDSALAHLKQFANLVAEHEREVCAKICDEHADDPVYCGEAIRARGQE
jgi:DNA-directed RNA polymerase subunit F